MSTVDVHFVAHVNEPCSKTWGTSFSNGHTLDSNSGGWRGPAGLRRITMERSEESSNLVYIKGSREP